MIQVHMLSTMRAAVVALNPPWQKLAQFPEKVTAAVPSLPTTPWRLLHTKGPPSPTLVAKRRVTFSPGFPLKATSIPPVAPSLTEAKR